MPESKPTEYGRISDASDGRRQFLIHPDDDDIFVRTGRQVIQACQLGISIEVWLDEFQSLRRRVAEWCRERTGRIKACYEWPRGGGIALFFVPALSQFDFDLADELAELNRALANEFNVGPIDLHQVPLDELDRFVPLPGTQRPLYTHGAPPSAVET